MSRHRLAVVPADPDPPPKEMVPDAESGTGEGR